MNLFSHFETKAEPMPDFQSVLYQITLPTALCAILDES